MVRAIPWRPFVCLMDNPMELSYSAAPRSAAAERDNLEQRLCASPHLQIGRRTRLEHPLRMRRQPPSRNRHYRLLSLPWGGAGHQQTVELRPNWRHGASTTWLSGLTPCAAQAPRPGPLRWRRGRQCNSGSRSPYAFQLPPVRVVQRIDRLHDTSSHGTDQRNRWRC